MIIHFERELLAKRPRYKHPTPLFMLIELAKRPSDFLYKLCLHLSIVVVSNHKQGTAAVQWKKSPTSSLVNTL